MRILKDITAIDRNDLNYIWRTYGERPLAAIPAPTKNGKINPCATTFLMKDGRKISTIHGKPIYYESVSGAMRPLYEVTLWHGSKRIELTEDWEEKMSLRYLAWLVERSEKLRNANVKIPVPIYGLVPLNSQNIHFTVSTFNGSDGVTEDGTPSQSYGAGAGVDWAVIRAAGGDGTDDTSAVLDTVYIRSDTVSDKWRFIFRGIFTYDTGGTIPDTDDVSAATYTLYGDNKADGLSITPNINVYSAAPAGNDQIVAGDFDSIGTTAYSTAITYANWQVNVSDPAANAFAFNATGIAAISKTGITKLGVRNGQYDADAVAPTWASASISSLACNFLEQTSTTRDPLLSVTHAAPVSPSVGGDDLKRSGDAIIFI